MMTTCAIPDCNKEFVLKDSLGLLEHLFCWHVGSNEAVRCTHCGYGAKWYTTDFRDHFRTEHDGDMIINDRRHLFSIKVSELLRDYYPEHLDQCQDTIRKWKASAERFDPKKVAVNAGNAKIVRVKDELLSPEEQPSNPSEGRKRRSTKPFTSDASNNNGYLKRKCSYCGMNVTRQNFARHAFSKHSDVPAYQCSYCDFRNNCSLSVVSTHVQTKHPDLPFKVINNYDTMEELLDRCFPGHELLAGTARRRAAAARRNNARSSLPPQPETQASTRSSKSRAAKSTPRDRLSVTINKLLACRKCGAQIEDTVAHRAEHFFRAHGQGKSKRYQCPYCADGDRDIESTMRVHIQLKHPGRRVVSIDRADKDKYRQMIDELFETHDGAKRARHSSSTPMLDQMLKSSKHRTAQRDPSTNDDVLNVYEKRSESAVAQRPMYPFGSTPDSCSQFNMQQAMMPMLGNGMGGMMMPFMPAMMQQLQNQNMTMMMMPMIVPIDFMKQMNQMMLTNGAFGQNA